jgi:CRP-like cAMP-binding protein
MKEQQLLTYIGQFGALNEQSLGLLRDSLEFQRFERGKTLWKAGVKCDKIFFLLNGLVRLFFYNEQGEEITVYFLDGGKFLADLESYNTGSPSSVTAIAEHDVELVVFRKPVMERLEREISGWTGVLKKISEKALFEKVKLRTDLFHREAKDRYLTFLQYFPSISNQVKAAHVASFLGMSQFTLSHIKKRLIQPRFFAK